MSPRSQAREAARDALPPIDTLRAVLLDAGNTLCFLDHGALATLATAAGEPLSASVLCDAEAPAKRAYEQLLREGGSHDAGWHLFMAQIFEHAGKSPAVSARLAQAAWREHTEFNLWRRVPEGLCEALSRLRARGIRVGVVSNSEGNLHTLLDRVGLSPYLDLVIDSGREGVRKPDPEIFQRALTRLGLAAQGCVYAGDIPEVDVGGARAAGIAGVLVDPFDHYPDFDGAPRVASVAELVARLL